jgi:type VI secretion system protein ImpJ
VGPDGAGCEFSLALPPRPERGVTMFRDENTGTSEKPVQIARKRFRLVRTADAPSGLTAMRVARVRLSPGGVHELDPSFIPPLLDIAANDFLIAILRRLVEILGARSSSISGGRRSRQQTLGEFTAADIPNFWLLHIINTRLPEFRHLYESRRGHPEALFAGMLELAGALTSFSPRTAVRDLPVYDHENLESCFGDLDRKLRSALESAVPRNCLSLPLKKVQPSIYAVSIEDERRFAGARVYLAVRTEEPKAALVEKAPKLLKVTSSSQIDRLVRQALPGVVLTHVPEPLGAPPVKLGFEYFALDQRGEAWDAVARSRSLAAYVPAELPGPELELIALSAPEGG